MLLRCQAFRRRGQPGRPGDQLAIRPQHLVVDTVLGIDAQRFDRDRRQVELEPAAGAAKVTGNRKDRIEKRAVVGLGRRIERDAIGNEASRHNQQQQRADQPIGEMRAKARLHPGLRPYSRIHAPCES